MSFADREYYLYVVLGNPAAGAIWRWEQWEAISKALDPIVAAAAQPPALRSFQQSTTEKPIRFGKIGWGKNGHQKWVHGSPANTAVSDSWEMVKTELWAPSWTASEKRKAPPDLYFAFKNEALSGGTILTFNPSIIIASASDMPNGWLEQVSGFVFYLSDLMKFKLRAYQYRRWGRMQFANGAVANAIGDLMVTSLFKPGPASSIEPSLDLLNGEWQVF